MFFNAEEMRGCYYSYTNSNVVYNLRSFFLFFFYSFACSESLSSSKRLIFFHVKNHTIKSITLSGGKASAWVCHFYSSPKNTACPFYSLSGLLGYPFLFFSFFLFTIIFIPKIHKINKKTQNNIIFYNFFLVLSF